MRDKEKRVWAEKTWHSVYSVYCRPMNMRELAKKLCSLGFKEISAKKHIKFKHTDGRWTVISKGSHEIDIALVKKIEQQIGEKLRQEK